MPPCRAAPPPWSRTRPIRGRIAPPTASSRAARGSSPMPCKARFAIGIGDRIGTLAWNDHRHFELYYGVAGIGAICHTINPRLFPEQIAYIINHAEDCYLFVDPMFVPLVERLAPQLPTVRGVVVLSDAAHMPESGLAHLHCYEALLEGQPDAFDWPLLDETTASGLCYTSGTTGNPRGALYHHRSTILHGLMLACPTRWASRATTSCCRWCRCSMPMPGGCAYACPLVGVGMVMPGAEARWRQPVRAARARARDLLGGRADDLVRPAQPPRRDRQAALHAAAGRDRRFCGAALDDRRVRGPGHRGPARLGDDRDEPGRRDLLARCARRRAAAGGAPPHSDEAGPPALGRRDADRRRPGPAPAPRRQRRPACSWCAAPGSPRPISATTRRPSRRSTTAGSRPATSPRSTRTATWRSPIAPRT